MKRFLIPLGLFIVLAIFLAMGLKLNPQEIPSPLVDKPAPVFSLPQLGAHPEGQFKKFASQDMLGKVWLLNVWASWCVSCRHEHPLLVDFAKLGVAPLIGLNYKDVGADADKWLAKFGNPYTLTAVDADGRVGIQYGVYGVPETYVIDKAGVIRFKQIGPVTQEALNDKILPMIRKLKQ